jgi:2-dehydro-3-deoxygalactonokinase
MSTPSTEPRKLDSSSDYFLSCDWGTSSFRLRLIDAQENQVLKETKKDIGVKSVFLQCDPSDREGRDKHFESFLVAECDQLLDAAHIYSDSITMMLSGMTTSSIGWIELPYANVPFPLDGKKAVIQARAIRSNKGRRIRCLLISGIQTETEMMRGEETELMGVFALEKYQGLLRECLAIVPGTHSKHVLIEGGEIVSIETFMTGELLEVLGRHSVLQATADLECVFDQKFKMVTETQSEAFKSGVLLARKSGLLGNLFQTRTRGVLKGASNKDNIWFLMGLLIGEEWRQLTARRVSSLPVLIAAGSRFGELYSKAAEVLGEGERVSRVMAEDMDLASTLGHRLLMSSRVDQYKDQSSHG